jgi:beta-lactamase regulating signal transducer with metallopeptidase domain
MTRETLLLATLQSGVLFLAIWLIFRLAPSIPPNAKAWIWRIAFLKPLASLLPFANVTLYVLPSSPSQMVITEGPGSGLSPIPVPVEASAATAADPILTLWLLGVAVLAFYGVANWVRALGIVRKAQKVTDETVLVTFRELTERAGVGTRVDLLCSEGVPSAMLVGGFRPAIVLPTPAIDRSNLADIRLMLAHEVAHLARRDLPWFGLIWAVQSLYFFNPLAWVAARCARLDHESATDRHASHLANVPIQTYAEMLLRATVVARTSLVPGSVPMAESYRTIHRRLEAMKHFNAQPTIWRKSAVAALALATVGLLPVYQLAEAAPSPQQSLSPKVTKARTSQTVKAPKPPRRIKLISQEKGKKDKVYTVELRNDRWVVLQKGKVVQVLKTKSGRPLPPVKTMKPTTKPPKVIVKPLSPSASMGQRTTMAVAGVQGGQVVTETTVAAHASTSGARASGQGTQVATGGSTSSSVQLDASPFVRRTSGQSEVATATTNAADQGNVATSATTVSMTLSNCDVRSALQSLFRHGKKDFEIDAKVQGLVTCSVHNVAFDVALRSMLRAVGATYRIEDGIYIITPDEKSE